MLARGQENVQLKHKKIRTVLSTTPNKARRQNLNTNLQYMYIDLDPKQPEQLVQAWRECLAKVASHGRSKEDSQLQVGFSQDRLSADGRFRSHVSNSKDLGTVVKGDVAIPKTVNVYQYGLVINGDVPKDFQFEEFGGNVAKADGWKLWNREEYFGLNANNRSGNVLYAVKIDTIQPRLVGYSGRAGRERGLEKKVRKVRMTGYTTKKHKKHVYTGGRYEGGGAHVCPHSMKSCDRKSTLCVKCCVELRKGGATCACRRCKKKKGKGK